MATPGKTPAKALETKRLAGMIESEISKSSGMFLGIWQISLRLFRFFEFSPISLDTVPRPFNNRPAVDD
jgi:hypothetical protein